MYLSRCFRPGHRLIQRSAGTLPNVISGSKFQKPVKISGQTFTTVSLRMASVQEFEAAKNRLNSLKESPDNSVKLQIYALFKQATVGPVNTKRPGMTDFVGRAKWDAWNELGTVSQEEARARYVKVINELAGAEASQPQAPPAEGVVKQYEGLEVSQQGKLRVLKFNRPQKKNAILIQTYTDIANELQAAAQDPSVSLVAMTGAGDFFCSGNDLSNLTSFKGNSPQEMAVNGGKILKTFVEAFIDFPKPLVAVVNGPAVGISVTIMGLMEAVYASDKATFHTPFSALGQSPEACSTVTFPRVLGPLNAAELLLFNQKYSAQQAAEKGLVTKVYPDAVLQQEVWPMLQEWAELPVKSMVYAKEMIRTESEKALLRKANDVEVERLVERWLSEDCRNALMKFFSREKKAKL